jgi:dTDP-4-dehydrorhamnose 3,5-epimerase
MAFTMRRSPIEGLVVIEPQYFQDRRGSFMETFKESEFAKFGIVGRFVQDNQSRSFRGVLRGLHFQSEPFAQAKLVRVVQGAVWDVAVDIRLSSPSYGVWYGKELSGENMSMLYIPTGFAHGFVTLRDETLVVYKCSAEYNKDCERGIRWDDPELGIEWPLADMIVSEKDQLLPHLRELARNCCLPG